MIHPAALWSKEAGFSPSDVDCTFTVMLKILDGKCKMDASEQAALIAIFDTVKYLPRDRLDESILQAIELARPTPTDNIKDKIHKLRVYAESVVPKSTMKEYKKMLREGISNFILRLKLQYQNEDA